MKSGSSCCKVNAATAEPCGFSTAASKLDIGQLNGMLQLFRTAVARRDPAPNAQRRGGCDRLHTRNTAKIPAECRGVVKVLPPSIRRQGLYLR